jgi:hypothetical protein
MPAKTSVDVTGVNSLCRSTQDRFLYVRNWRLLWLNGLARRPLLR